MKLSFPVMLRWMGEEDASTGAAAAASAPFFCCEGPVARWRRRRVGGTSAAERAPVVRCVRWCRHRVNRRQTHPEECCEDAFEAGRRAIDARAERIAWVEARFGRIKELPLSLRGTARDGRAAASTVNPAGSNVQGGFSRVCVRQATAAYEAQRDCVY